MINIDLIHKTAEELMCKAAIEIPEDYLGGLKGREYYDFVIANEPDWANYRN